MSKDKPRRMVDIDLFTHPKMRDTSATAKALFVYLLLPSPCGIVNKSIRQMRLAVDRGATDDDLRRALEQLCDAGVVRWDEENEVAWVVNALRRQAKGASPKLGTAVRNYLATIPPSPLLDEFYERYHDWLVKAGVINPGDAPPLRVVDGGAAEPSIDPCEEPSAEACGDGLRNPSRNPSASPQHDPIPIPYPDTLSGCGMGISVTVTETVTETVNQSSLHRGSSRQIRDVRRFDDDDSTMTTSGPSAGSEYLEAEGRIRMVFEEAMAVPVGPGAYRWAMERWQTGDATLDEILRVVDWWRNNREQADCQLRECFMKHGNGARWSRVEALALGRSPASSRRGGGRGGGGHGRRRSSNAEARAAVRAAYARQNDG